MSDTMPTVDEIQREQREREKGLRIFIDAFSTTEFFSGDVVDLWQEDGSYWTDRQHAFGVVQRLLVQMEREGILTSRLDYSSTRGTARRYYRHR